MTVDPRWYESIFEGAEWLLLASTLPPERTQLEADFCASHLPPGGKILDVPCGTARHAELLAGRSAMEKGVGRHGGAELPGTYPSMRRCVHDWNTRAGGAFKLRFPSLMTIE